MKNSIFIFIILLLGSCIKEESSFSSSYLKNSTYHTIEIVPYLDGKVESFRNLKISSQTEIGPIEALSSKGKGLISYYADGLAVMDSVIIVFDGLKRSKHKRFNDTTNMCDYCIPYSHTRAISNQKNWIKTITKEEKYSSEGFFTYTFTEQDYLDAK